MCDCLFVPWAYHDEYIAQTFQILNRHDVILEIDGKKVANDGTIEFRRSERVFFDYELLSKQVGDVCRCVRVPLFFFFLFSLFFFPFLSFFSLSFPISSDKERFLITTTVLYNCRLRILRNKEIMDVEVEVQPPDYLVPPTTYDQLPKYFIHSGFVFTTFTQPYLHEWGDEWYYTSPRKLYHKVSYLGIPYV